MERSLAFYSFSKNTKHSVVTVMRFFDYTPLIYSLGVCESGMLERCTLS